MSGIRFVRTKKKKERWGRAQDTRRGTTQRGKFSEQLVEARGDAFRVGTPRQADGAFEREGLARKPRGDAGNHGAERGSLRPRPHVLDDGGGDSTGGQERHSLDDALRVAERDRGLRDGLVARRRHRHRLLLLLAL